MSDSDASLVSRQLLRPFGTQHTPRVALGTCLGVSLYIVIYLSAANLGLQVTCDAMRSLGLAPFGAAGVALTVWPVVFKRREVPSKVIDALEIVEQILERGHLSLARRKDAYDTLLNIFLSEYRGDLTEGELRKLATTMAESVTSSPPDPRPG